MRTPLGAGPCGTQRCGEVNHNDFATPALLQIAADSLALVTSSWHSNAGEYYVTNALVFLRGGKLEPIDTFSAYSETSCGLLSRQSYAFSSALGSPYYAVTAALSYIGGTPTVEPYDHSVTKTYHWDSGENRFVTGTP
jgi:hypothetical protein